TPNSPTPAPAARRRPSAGPPAGAVRPVDGAAAAASAYPRGASHHEAYQLSIISATHVFRKARFHYPKSAPKVQSAADRLALLDGIRQPRNDGFQLGHLPLEVRALCGGPGIRAHDHHAARAASPVADLGSRRRDDAARAPADRHRRGSAMTKT